MIKIDKMYMTLKTKDGKMLYYHSTEGDSFGKGHFTDVFKDAEGKIYHVDRIENAIVFPTHARNTGAGNMISFGVNFKQLLIGINTGVNDAELDRLIRKCEYSLSKALQYYQKEDSENAQINYEQAVKDGVTNQITEFYKEERNVEPNQAIERLLNVQRMQDNKELYTALSQVSTAFNIPQTEDEGSEIDNI